MLRNYRLQNYNFKLVFNVLVLMAMSLLFIHSAKASYVPKQALGIIMGLGIIVVVSLIDYQVFTRNAEILYILNVIMLIGVIWKRCQWCQTMVFIRSIGNFPAIRT